MDKTLAREMKLSKWASDLQNAEASGLGHREWCRMNNISYSTFKYWVRAVNFEINNRRSASNVSITGTQFAEVPAAIYQAGTSHSPNADLISIELGNTRIAFPLSSTPEQIKTVLEVLTHAQ